VPIWVLTTAGGVGKGYTYWDGHEDSNGDSGCYSECCLSIVIRCEEARVLEGAVYCEHMLIREAKHHTASMRTSN